MTKKDNEVIPISKTALYEYLSSVYGEEVKIRGIWELGRNKTEIPKDLKGFGYGAPYVVKFTVGKFDKKVVLGTMLPNEFGHEHFSDRAQALLWQHSVFDHLPRHVHSIDVGAFTENPKKLKSLGDCTEFFILTEFVPGELYHVDLDRIRETGFLEELDERRCLALSDYLADIHGVKNKESKLYIRRVRELVGHGECIMGLLDSYPSDLDYLSESDLISIEQQCVAWRWRLKHKSSRLCQVHGDFHPWNVKFQEDVNFKVIDRSRGEWGEAADDLAAMTINYLFYSLQKYGKLSGVFQRLFHLFWERYLQKTRDHAILEVIPPFYAWRGLVLASPIWYPDLNREVRITLFNFIKNVLKLDRFDLERVNSYLTME